MRRRPPEGPHLQKIYDSQGREVRLGRQLGRGGEGAVYEVADAADVVAKVYHRPVGAEKAAKLAAMATAASPDLIKIGAWPTATLHAERGEDLIGILMPKVSGFRDVHILYSPAHRKATFPQADWAFLVHTARNVAQAFETIHAAGHVIADVNQGNVLVSPKAIVKLIDCDSFQIRANGRYFQCEVGVAHFTPPELQGRSFRGITRTSNHDNFGLAILAFHLLFMGRHPFAGRFHGTGDMPIEKAISEFRFAFSQTAAATRQMTPPPHCLRLAHASFGVASLFERAFGPASGQGGRPTAREWRAVLETLGQELKPCGRFAGHKFHKSLPDCPWCEIDRGGGPDFFIAITVTARLRSNFDLNAIWAAITMLGSPDPQLPGLTSVSGGLVGAPLPQELRQRRTVGLVAGALGIAILLMMMVATLPPAAGLAVPVLFGVWLLMHNSALYGEERKRRQEALRQAQVGFDAVKSRWEREVASVARDFLERRRALEQKRAEYLGLAPALQRDREKLNAKREELQRHHFLEKFFIEKHRVSGIGPGLRATLQSFNIETAADVTAAALENVPGFGPARINELLKWRKHLEQRFRFDPQRGIDPADVAALEQRYVVKREAIERALAAAPVELQRLAQAAKRNRDAILPELARRSQALSQRQADAAVMQ